ncbi:TonB-dependent receptor plug domain-containing protein [Treponema sp.]|uniref:TonB-dependent receptor n=1 Tax=Treponema sp. TaxID=166 RepID=UPI00298E02DB|nr:TonB-dependent receptor plug domain-containing protein [Treponema sp.]MCQ2242277.1 TonB-dependent receptor plug domain-containing protein [Treponema sp.]
MKKVISLIVLSGLFISEMFSGEVRLSVIDADLEIPLEGVKVYAGEKSKEAAYTDENGQASIEVSDENLPESIVARLPGYKDEIVTVKSGETEIEIRMTLADVIEGKELIVNRATPETSQEKVGVSTVMSKEKMHSTATMGIIEDCMASVRTLPGVSYSGAWGSEPSVRGGSPRELAVTLDGMYTIFPWHWGGGNSILNPSMIESVKLSNGIFSARYGKASSGLLEATTLKPDFEKPHLNASVSTMSADVFAQVPFGKNVGGMIFGTHLTYLEPLFAMYNAAGSDALDMIKRPPYIRDFFLKTNFKPSSILDVSLMGFFGSDGLSIDSEETKDGFRRNVVMDYDIYQGLAGVNVKYLPTDNLQLHALLSYNGMYEDLTQKSSENGKIKYTEEFAKKYSGMNGVAAGNSYTLNGINNQYEEKITSHLVNGKIESEIELNDKNYICTGFEEIIAICDSKENISSWRDIQIGNDWRFVKTDWQNDVEGNWIYNTAGFCSWTYGNDTSLINSELGVRAEFMSLNNRKKNYNLNLVPQVCPRASLTFTPWREIGNIRKASIITGTGIFVSTPRETMIISDECGVENYDLKPNSALLAVLGGDVELENDWKFKLETYYKHYLSRMYMYTVSDASTGYSQDSLKVKSDGKGHVFGIDAMIEKNVGKAWDGYLSYSFVYTRFKNPAGIGEGQKASSFSDVLDEWFYPSYHRFNTINLVSNWHFGEGWTFTLKGTLATGTPKEDVGGLTCYAVTMADGTVVQRYTRSSFYSDTLRNQISCPVDIRISKEWLSHGGKAKWEFYFAVQDIFVNLYAPKGNKSYDSYTGEMSEAPESVDFNIGVPLPSVGIKVRF